MQALPEDRMQVLWSMISKVPVDFLFYNEATFDKEGLRWGPCILLRSKCNSGGFEEAYSHTDEHLDEVESCAEVTARGLFVELSGLLFTSKRISFQSFIYLLDKETVYRFNPFPFDVQGRPEPPKYSASDLAFILNGEQPIMETGMPHQGILAAVCSHEKNIIRVKKICNGYCETLTAEFHRRELDQLPLLNTLEGGGRTLSKEVPIQVVARWTAPKQKWIMD